MEGSPCTHVHDEACGYAEAVEEVLCACTETDDTGATVHTEGCGYVAPLAGSDCTHAHDETCGYVEAAEGSECTYVCEESHGDESAEEPDTIPARITDVTITVDGVEYGAGQTAVITPNTQSIFCTVYGTNLQNGTENNSVMYSYGSSISGDSTLWVGYSEDGTTMTWDFSDQISGFYNNDRPTEIKYTNDDNTWIGTGLYVHYSEAAENVVYVNLMLKAVDESGNVISGTLDAVVNNGNNWISNITGAGYVSRWSLTVGENTISGWDYCPDGYVKPTEPITFTATADGRITVTSGNATVEADDTMDYIVVTLEKETIELPDCICAYRCAEGSVDGACAACSADLTTCKGVQLCTYYFNVTGFNAPVAAWLYSDAGYLGEAVANPVMGSIYAVEMADTVTTVMLIDAQEGIIFDQGIELPTDGSNLYVLSTGSWIVFTLTPEGCAHTGGTATCIAQAACAACGESYGELGDVHSNMSSWNYYDTAQHYRYCTDCTREDSYEYGTHTGGTATCITLAECTECEEKYGQLSNNHSSMTEWEYYDAAQHFRYCAGCTDSSSYEYRDHSFENGACTGCGEGDLVLTIGDNEIRAGNTYTYTAEQDGTLYVTVMKFFYGVNGVVSQGNLNNWCAISINGTAITEFANTVEVSTGDTVTVEVKSLDNDVYYGTVKLDWEAPTFAEITGASITVDGTLYTQGNVTITPTSSVVFTVTGTNFAAMREENRLASAPNWSESLNFGNWDINTETNTATFDFHWQDNRFVDCDNFEVSYSNDGYITRTGTGIFLTYSNGDDGVCPHTYDNKCDASCNLCGEKREVDEHFYISNCDKDCEYCGFARDQDDLQHTYNFQCDTRCVSCGEITRPEAEHLKNGPVCKDSVCAYNCGAYMPATNQHDWNCINAVPPTCSMAGKYNYQCVTCGDRYEEVSPAPGHNREILPGKEATCTEPGLTEGEKCVTCGEIVAPQYEIPAPGHTPEALPGKEANCTEPGMTDGTRCSECKEILTPQEEIPVNGRHVRSYNCSTDCALCGETAWPEAEHVSDAPACTDGVCDYGCGTELPATEQHESDKPACVDGLCKYGCGVTFPAAVNHERSTPACTDGLCGNGCGTLITAFADHNYDNACDTDCNFCFAVREVGGHTEEILPGKEATCTEPGLTDGMCCADCGEIITPQEPIHAPGHNYEEGACTVCGAVYVEAQITGVSITVDGETYTEGNVTIKPDSTIVYTLTGVNFAYLSDEAFGFNGHNAYFVYHMFTVDTETNTAVWDCSDYIAYFEDCAGDEVLYSNNGGESWFGTGIYLTYDDGTASEPTVLAITKQPTDASAKLGERYCVTVEAEGEGLTYQWYIKNAGATKWSKSSVTDNTYDDVMTAARHNRELKCVVTDAWGNQVETSPVVVIMATQKHELQILQQPNDAGAKLGEGFCVTVEAQGDGLKYQWYWRNAGTETWKLSGQRDNTYDDVMTAARHNREVYCVIIDAWGYRVTTETVTLTCIESTQAIAMN